jgi:MFS family permease
MEEKSVSLSSYWRLVRGNRNFRLLWLAQIVSEIGDWLYAVAIYSLLLEYTGSAKSVAFAFVLQVLPQFFVAPSAGVINDRLSRKRVMIFADWMRAVIVLGMLLVRSPDLVWFLYLLLFLETIFWAIFEPGRSAVIPNITRGEDVLVANALSSTTWSFNLAVGSAIGGTLAVVFGRVTVFALNAGSFVCSALLLRRMSFEEPHAENLAPLRLKDLFDFSPILEGIRYVSTDARLSVTMFIKAGLGLMGTNWVLLPIFAERVFPVSVDWLGPQRATMLGMSILLGCRGVGALIGPLIGNALAGHSEIRLRQGILLGFICAALGYFGLYAAPTLALACLAVIFSHAGGSVIWVFSTTLLQLRTEDRFRGRVFSTELAFHILTVSSVSALAGVLVDAGYSVRALAALTGLVVAVPALGWWMAQRLWQRPSPC